MAEPAPVFTGNHEKITDSEIRSRFDHIDDALHRIMLVIDELATPEARRALQGFLNNPAMRFALRGKKTS